MIAGQKKGNEFDMNQFRGLGKGYSDSEIDSDIGTVERLKKKFAQKAEYESDKRVYLGKIFEQIILENFNKWIASIISIQEPFPYDDFVNGVDAIVEIKEPTEINYLALALDATHGGVVEKIARIKEQIDNEEFSTVKYYQNSDGSFMGALKEIPRVIIGADKDKILDLAKLWIEGRDDELLNHPIQFQIFDEIIMQLETYLKYSREATSNPATENYKIQLALFKKYRTEKLESKGSPDYSYRQLDRSYICIKKTMDNFEKLEAKK